MQYKLNNFAFGTNVPFLTIIHALQMDFFHLSNTTLQKQDRHAIKNRHAMKETNLSTHYKTCTKTNQGYKNGHFSSTYNVTL